MKICTLHSQRNGDKPGRRWT